MPKRRTGGMPKKRTKKSGKPKPPQLLSASTAPPSQPKTDDENVEDAVQEESTEERTNEDSQTTIELQQHIVDEQVIYLPTGYTDPKILGMGAHGVVVAVKAPSDTRQIAIKQIKLQVDSSDNETEQNLYQWKSSYRELSLLMQLTKKPDHPNVIRVIDALVHAISENEYELMFLTSLMEESLDKLMKSTSLTNNAKKRYIHQILCGLAYLHSNKIVHRDLKPANVLVSGDELRIADLGQARVWEIVADDISVLIRDNGTPRLPDMTINGVGTFIYRAPELHFQYPEYSYPVDMWSVGCIFAEMFLKSKKPLFTTDSTDDNFFLWIGKVFELIGTPTAPEDIEWIHTSTSLRPANWLPYEYAAYVRSLCSNKPSEADWSRLSTIDETALDLIKKLLKFNPSKRITAAEALEHPYFSDMSLSALQEMPSSSSSSPPISLADVGEFTSIEQVRVAICKLIEQIRQNH